MGSGAAAATATAPTPGTDTEKSFVCPTCSRVFNKKANLKVHSRKHTGEKPYACSKPGCGRAFMWKSSVTFHEQNCPAAKKDLNSNSTSSHSSLPPPLPSLKGVQKRPKPVAMSAATTVATNSSSPPRTRISPARDRSLLSVPTTSPSIASTPPSSSSTLLSAARRHTLAAVPGTPTTPEDPMPCPTVSQPLHFTLAPLPPPRPSSETPQPLFVPPHSMWGLMSSSPSPSVSSAQQAPPPTQAPTSQQPTSSTQEPSLRTVFGRPPLFHVPSRTDVPHTLPAPATLLQDDRTGASALRPPIPPVGAITLAGPFSKHLFPLHSANKDSRPSVLTTTNASTGLTTTPTTTTATTTTGGLNTGTVTLPSSHALVTSVSLVANTAVTPPTVTGGTTGNGGGFNTRLPPPPSAPAPSSAKPPTMPGVMPVNGGGGVSKMPKMPITMDLDDSDDETPMKIVGAQDAFIRSGNPFKGFAPPPRCSPLPVSSPIVCGVSPMPLSPLAPFSPLPPDSPAHHAPNPVHPPINQCVTRSTSMGW